ncbi:hypothetical protein jhhlp_004798 [Lomentospora prolificans]|uniref:NADH:flavin oxidoreductase/NADH oxidase N-terminal domain-containing protein n=1 Tax=Lomentospora prolificans TaxID=41688 RepID=A0A2N3N8J1_9PEZI|nr:hypothetical protein jhhlp_004798 [Lomentospora prolificans]
MAQSKLFQPISIGRHQLQHRIVMAPLTRFRADEDNLPLPMMIEYYTQRASSPGTLIISEAIPVSLRHCFGPYTTGLWNEAQIQSWKEITDAIHAKSCFIYAQLWAPGRIAAKEGYPLYSSSAVPMEPGAPIPQAMTEAEIYQCISDFENAAMNAIKAGFDGVELHGANGYLFDQFSQDTCNKRTDKWGGSVENRSRFILETTKAVAKAVGNARVGVRLSPWSLFQGMKMETALATEQFSHIIRGLKELHISYLHLIESRVVNHIDCDKKEGLEFAFDIWKNQSPIIVAGGFNGDKARKAVDEEYNDHDTLVAFGRYFVSTPDLVFRVRNNIEPNQYDRSTFYTPMKDEGYIDYPFSDRFLSAVAA